MTNDIEDAATAILNIGVAILGGSTSSVAQSSLVEGSAESAIFGCTEGGFYGNDGSRIQESDCQENGVILNGTVPYSFNIDTGELFVTLNQISVFDVSTGQESFWAGTLSFVANGNLFVTNGSVSVSSNVLGSYQVTFFDVTVDSNHVTVSGGFEVAVRQGAGAFAGISAIRFETLAHGIDRVEIDVIGDGTLVYYFAFTLCDPCTTDDVCAEGLACFPCNDQCSGDTRRCSVDIADVFLDCADGFF